MAWWRWGHHDPLRWIPIGAGEHGFAGRGTAKGCMADLWYAPRPSWPGEVYGLVPDGFSRVNGASILAQSIFLS